MHSDKRSAQLFFSALQKAGIDDIIISPGSRNAPLVIEALARGFNPDVVVDERVAGFTALGMAQQSRKPAVVISTSGTAVLNYHPAVAEAFYAKIPLIVVSADRPPYRIDKGEGQTIRQHEVLKNHTLFSATLPLDGNGQETEALIREALETAVREEGPVHLNMPFEEPLYQQTGKAVSFTHPPTPLITPRPIPDQKLDILEKIWKKARRKLLIVSQNHSGDVLGKQMERLAAFGDTVVLTENLANVHGSGLHAHIDRLIFPMDEKEWEKYAPDLVITVGRNIISKKIKYLLRAVKPAYGHWHIGKENFAPDTFDSLTEHFPVDPEMFFSQLLYRIYDHEPGGEYKALWRQLAAYRQEKHDLFAERLPASDMLVYKTLSNILAGSRILQWGNSTVVRYAQLFPFTVAVKHFANRGTSGIDGTVSTAVGAARKSPLPVLAVTGDLAFQYDNNAFWQEIPGNFKLIVINNGGGDIFRFIPGPSGVKDYEKYFVFKHRYHYGELALHFGLSYDYMQFRTGTPPHEISEQLKKFLQSPGPRIMEIDTRQIDNARILKDYFTFLK